MTPNTDALLSLQRRESVPNNVRGIQRFCSHIMDVPITHTELFLSPMEGHILLLLLFFTLSVFTFSRCFFLFFLSGSLTFSPFQAMYLVTRLFYSEPFIVISHFVFPLVAELFQEGSTLTRHLFQSSHQNSPNPFQVSSSTSVSALFLVLIRLLLSCPFLSTVSDGHWATGTQGDKGPLTLSRWLGRRLICLCHPRHQNTKAQRYEGLHFTPSPQL